MLFIYRLHFKCSRKISVFKSKHCVIEFSTLWSIMIRKAFLPCFRNSKMPNLIGLICRGVINISRPHLWTASIFLFVVLPFWYY